MKNVFFVILLYALAVLVCVVVVKLNKKATDVDAIFVVQVLSIIAAVAFGVMGFVKLGEIVFGI
jgi:hypothetical protein